MMGNQARKSLKNLDRSKASRIMNWINENLKDCENPRAMGKALTGGLKGLWSYEVAGDYRVVAEIDDTIKIIEIENIDHRKEVYKKTKRGK